jgi:hypothetical protein
MNILMLKFPNFQFVLSIIRVSLLFLPGNSLNKNFETAALPIPKFFISLWIALHRDSIFVFDSKERAIFQKFTDLE